MPWWMRYHFLPTFDADGGGSGSGDGSADEGGEGKPGDQSADPPKDPPKSGEETEKPEYTKAQLEAKIKERLDRANAAREKADKDAADQAALDKAKADGEKDTVISKLEDRVKLLGAAETERDALRARVDQLEAALNGEITTMSKDLPDYITDALTDMDPIAKLKYLAKHRDKIVTGGSRRPGPPDGTRGNGGGPKSGEALETEAAAQASRRRYDI